MWDVKQAKLAQLAKPVKQTEGMITYGFVHLLLEILNCQNSSDGLISILYPWNQSRSRQSFFALIFRPLCWSSHEAGVQA